MFGFYPNDNLYKDLELIEANFTVEELSLLVENMNDILVKENGNGPMTNVVKEIKYQSKLLRKQKNYSPFRVSVCSATFFSAGLLHSGIYTAAGVALGVTGVGAALVPFLIGAAYGAGGLLCP